MTQYGELGCILWHNYAFKISHFLYEHTYIVSVEGSSIVLYIECLGGMFPREIFKKVAQFDESYFIYLFIYIQYLYSALFIN